VSLVAWAATATGLAHRVFAFRPSRVP